MRCATLRGPPRGRADRAGWLPRCVRTDGRVEACAKLVPTLVELRTLIEQWVLKEQHSQQTFGQWRRHQPDGQSGLPSTVLDHLSAMERLPMSPPRPCVSVGTIHDQNASGWHLATSVVERVIRQLTIIIEISHRIGASWPLALGADGGCLVLSLNHSKSTPFLLARHKYQNPNHHAAASLPFKFVPAPLGVAHNTNATRPTATARTTRPRHANQTHGVRAGRGGARTRTRRASYFESSSSRRHR